MANLARWGCSKFEDLGSKRAPATAWNDYKLSVYATFFRLLQLGLSRTARCLRKTFFNKSLPKISVRAGNLASQDPPPPCWQSACRFNETQTDEERSSPENCVLLCKGCHLMIDHHSGWRSFDVPLLLDWKAKAEAVPTSWCEMLDIGSWGWELQRTEHVDACTCCTALRAEREHRAQRHASSRAVTLVPGPSAKVKQRQQKKKPTFGTAQS